ncbi:MAG: D-alanyl-D-alanine carboxypeptidase [Oscillospiraceae bacterium]|nr:D-alanyl-D-alanine carboxypeptidase [Oscillospiraceae bacterium]
MKRLGILLAIVLLLGTLAAPARATDLQVAGKSALLMDIATGTVIYENNAHEKLAPASVTKVMTLLLIMEAIDSGRIRWEDTVTASEAAAAKGGSQIFLKAGETMSVSDMVKSIAVSSANDCACAMAEHIAGSETAFVEKMNARAAQLGMEDTHFVNCTGLDDGEDAASHLTSAYDIAVMSRELMKNHPDITKFTTIWMDTVRGGSFGLANTNKLVRFYPGATGLKTGFTSAAGYCLSATAQRDSFGLIAVVMGAATSQERFNSCKQMLDYGFASFCLAKPQLPAENTVRVKLGTATQVKAVPAESIELLIDKSQQSSITTEVTLQEELTAPISEGERLGMLVVKSGEHILAQVPMVAESAVTRLSFWDIFAKVLGRITMAAPA